MVIRAASLTRAIARDSGQIDREGGCSECRNHLEGGKMVARRGGPSIEASQAESMRKTTPSQRVFPSADEDKSRAGHVASTPQALSPARTRTTFRVISPAGVAKSRPYSSTSWRSAP